MPTLSIDVDANPWAIQATLPLDRALGLPVDDPGSSAASIAYLVTPRRDPGRIEEPIAIDVAGTTPSSWMHRMRGFAPAVFVDLVVAPEIAQVLGAARLLPHARVDALATIYRKGLTRSREHPAPVPMVWIWWTVDWDAVDFTRSHFAVHRRDGAVTPATFEGPADLEHAMRQAERGGSVVVPTELERNTAPREDDVDLWPLPEHRWRLSTGLAAALRSAGIRGVLIDD